MSSYRFCRTDDIPLLVRAYNRCYRVHFDDLPEMTVDDFRRRIRELNLWCSSCMVAAAEDKEPIAVLLATKRDTENLIWRIGVHPDHLRNEHGRHLLTSLGAKLAILGPRRMTAEVPADWGTACSFFEACGYTRERTYFDFEYRPSAEAGATAEGQPSPSVDGPADERVAPPSREPASPVEQMIVPVSVHELVENDAFGTAAPRCWKRSPQTLLNLGDRIRGIAIVSDRIEAYLLHAAETVDGAREILALDCRDEERREPLLGVLVRRFCADAPAPVRFSKVWSDEVPFSLLDKWGFRRSREYVGFASEAAPA